jgi:hypothetical protein
VPWINASRFVALRALIHRFGVGPLRSDAPPEEQANVVCFRVLVEVVKLLEEFVRRLAAGERVRLVEREHPPERGRLVLEIAVLPSSSCCSR